MCVTLFHSGVVYFIENPKYRCCRSSYNLTLTVKNIKCICVCVSVSDCVNEKWLWHWRCSLALLPVALRSQPCKRANNWIERAWLCVQSDTFAWTNLSSSIDYGQVLFMSWRALFELSYTMKYIKYTHYIPTPLKS